MGERFSHFANRMSALAGHYLTFIAAVLILVIWVASGPFFGFSDTWQLFINTGTTIVTFLMVFLIQNTQNRDARAMHLKLDELIRAIEAADNAVMHAEDETEDEMKELKRQYAELSGKHAALAREHADLHEDHRDLEQKVSGSRE